MNELTDDEFNLMMAELEKILGCELQTEWGRY
jgi:hypothetical protein